MPPSMRVSIIFYILLEIETQVRNNGAGDSKERHVKALTGVIHPQDKIKKDFRKIGVGHLVVYNTYTDHHRIGAVTNRTYR